MVDSGSRLLRCHPHPRPAGFSPSRPVLAALAAAATACVPSHASGETWENWLAPAQADAGVCFVAAAPPVKISRIATATGVRAIPELSPGRLLGWIDLSACEPGRFPAIVRTELATANAERVPDGDEGSDFWKGYSWGAATRCFRPGDEMPAAIWEWERSIALPTDGGRVAIWATPLPGDRLRQIQLPVQVRAEVRDRSGAILLRCVPAEMAVGSASTGKGSAGTEKESDRFLGLLGVEKIDGRLRSPLPPVESFLGTRAAWFDESLLAGDQTDAGFLRRILLGGTLVCGRPRTVERIGERIGLPPHRGVLDAGLFNAEEKPPWQPGDEYLMIADFLDPERDEGDRNPFGDPSALASPVLRRLAVRSIANLGLFLIAACATTFCLFSASRRAWLWIAIPALACAWAVATLLFLPRIARCRPAAEIIDYRYSFAGWPEALIETSLRLLRFDGRPIQILGPGQVFPDATRNPTFHTSKGRPERPPDRWRLSDDGAASELTLAPRTGHLRQIWLRRWDDGPPPCEAVGKDVRFLQDAGCAWILAGGRWRKVSPVQRGQVVDITKLPEPFKADGSDSAVGTVSSPLASLPDRLLPLGMRLWWESAPLEGYAIALLRRDGAGAFDVAAPADSGSIRRTIEIHQFPWPGAGGDNARRGDASAAR